MTKLDEIVDDATRSRMANTARRSRPDLARKNLYAIFDKQQSMCMVVVATDAEEALKLCHEAGLRSWTLRDCVCRSIVRNVDEDEQGLVTAVKLRKH